MSYHDTIRNKTDNLSLSFEKYVVSENVFG